MGAAIFRVEDHHHGVDSNNEQRLDIVRKNSLILHVVASTSSQATTADRLPCASQTQEESSLMILSAWPPKATLGSAPKSPQHIFVNIQFNEILAMEAPWRP